MQIRKATIMRKFKVAKNPYDDGNRKLFTKVNFELEDNSIVCFVGCNGTGKTTVLDFIQQDLHKNKALDLISAINPFRSIFVSNKETYKDMYISFDKEADITTGEGDYIMSHFAKKSLSTGEWIVNRFGRALALLGSAIRDPKNKGKNVFIFFDDCDAGTSIDMIGDIKSVFDLIIEDCKKNDITYYFCLTANSYEMCKDYRCIDVSTFKEHRFNNYEEYKKFVLKSRKFKDKDLGTEEG